MGKIYLSVVIPCFDEMTNLQKGVLDKIEHFLSKKRFSYEVIVVDDGSTDGSVDFVKAFIHDNKHFRLIENPHLGKAGAVTAGMLAARGDIVLFTDMDQATPIEEIERLLPHFGLVDSYDIVIGSRSGKRKGAPFTRMLMGRGMMILRDIIVGIRGISDTQCGFKAFKGDVAKKLFTRMKELHHGFSEISGSAVKAGFDVELLLLAQKMGYTIKEVPVTWLYVETRRVSPLRDSVDGFIDLLQIKGNALKGLYD